ncbi:MAG: CHASE2 domain-containing protein, partial [Gammaproteobacteria bacterium]|nr:CHASE2 domain-containing protein [Gammaproteobacteria bacterium]
MRSLKSIRDNVRKRRMRELLGSYRNRVWLLLILNLLGFLLLGRSAILPGMPDDEWVALDQWVRTAVFAVVRPNKTTPVTYVDIDNALYRDTWGMPTVTPRDALVSMVSSLAQSGATVVVVDIDLAWGDADPGLDEFLANHAGPAPLVFVRHLEETANGIRDIATPYDERFENNGEWLKWAHAYFFSDGDGALREWLPWLGVCDENTSRVLPAVATLTSELTAGNSSARPDISDCVSSEELVAHPIIFTEEFGFVAAGENSGAAAFLVDPKSPARKLQAAYLLDGTAIDYAAMFNGRIAVLGGSHTAGQDLRLTPMGVLPGAVIQANTIIHAGPQLAS